MVEDPVYLTEPLVQSQNFALVANVTPETHQTWTVCLASQEIVGGRQATCAAPSPGHQSVSQGTRQVPPSVRGDALGAEAMYPEYQVKLRQMLRAQAPGEAAAHAQVSRGSDSTSASSSGDPELQVLQVAADVYVIGGAGGNITVNVGSNGLFVVDAGTEGASANVVAAIRTISDRPIRYWRTPVRMRTTSAGTLRSGRSVRESTRENREEGR